MPESRRFFVLLLSLNFKSGEVESWGTSIQIDLEKKSGTLLMVQRVGEWPEWLIQGTVPAAGITEKHN